MTARKNNTEKRQKPSPRNKDHLSIKSIKPITMPQRTMMDSFVQNLNVLAIGSAGTGKTFLAVYLALQNILSFDPERKEKILFIRSAVPARNVGFLPGSLEEKNDIYALPFKQIVNQLCENGTAWDILVKKKLIEFQSTSYLRGLTFDNTIIILDECFPPGTEVLTDRGFIKFENLDKTEKIAQIFDDSFEFVEPLRYIEKDYDGEMVTISKDRFSITTTANHELVYVSNKNEEYKQKAIAKTYSHHSLKTSIIVKEEDSLSEIELAKIGYLCAIQADGSYETTIQTNGIEFNYWMVSFKKEDKINRFRNILKVLGIEHAEYKKDKKGRIRFYLGKNNPEGLIESKEKYFDSPFILNKSSIWHKAFIKETWLWDGSLKGETPLYCSTNKNNIELVQTIGHLVGYRCRIITSIDNRKSNFNDYYRLTFAKTNKISLQNHNKEITSYNGKVYCVEVPSGKIMIRQNGNIFITGNCQNVDEEEMKTILTRLGENSQIIICGDSKQNDLFRSKEKSSFEFLQQISKRMPEYFDVINFLPQDIVRSGFVKKLILVMEDM